MLQILAQLLEQSNLQGEAGNNGLDQQEAAEYEGFSELLGKALNEDGELSAEFSLDGQVELPENLSDEQKALLSQLLAGKDLLQEHQIQTEWLSLTQAADVDLEGKVSLEEESPDIEPDVLNTLYPEDSEFEITDIQAFLKSIGIEETEITEPQAPDISDTEAKNDVEVKGEVKHPLVSTPVIFYTLAETPAPEVNDVSDEEDNAKIDALISGKKTTDASQVDADLETRLTTALQKTLAEQGAQTDQAQSSNSTELAKTVVLSDQPVDQVPLQGAQVFNTQVVDEVEVQLPKTHPVLPQNPSDIEVHTPLPHNVKTPVENEVHLPVTHQILPEEPKQPVLTPAAPVSDVELSDEVSQIINKLPLEQTDELKAAVDALDLTTDEEVKTIEKLEKTAKTLLTLESDTDVSDDSAPSFKDILNQRAEVLSKGETVKAPQAATPPQISTESKVYQVDESSVSEVQPRIDLTGIDPEQVEIVSSTNTTTSSVQTGQVSATQINPIDQVVQSSNQASKIDSVNVANQVVEGVKSAASAGKQEVVLQLNPESLGSVRVRFVANAQQQINVMMIAESLDAHDLLQKELDLLHRSLDTQGVQVNKMHIVVAGGAESHFNSQAEEQDSQQNQQNQQQANKEFEQDFQQQAQEQLANLFGESQGDRTGATSSEDDEAVSGNAASIQDNVDSGTDADSTTHQDNQRVNILA